MLLHEPKLFLSFQLPEGVMAPPRRHQYNNPYHAKVTSPMSQKEAEEMITTKFARCGINQGSSRNTEGLVKEDHYNVCSNCETFSKERSEQERYTAFLHGLGQLVPRTVPPNVHEIANYIRHLTYLLQGMDIPGTTMTEDNIRKTCNLINHVVTEGSRREHNRNQDLKDDCYHKCNKRQEIRGTTYADDNKQKPYSGRLPKCNKCTYHHRGSCKDFTCKKCKKLGHVAKYCRNFRASLKPTTIPAGIMKIPRNCYQCGSSKHFKKNCPNLKQN